jgi:hypothetical protein
MFDLVPRGFQQFQPQHRRLVFSTTVAATVLFTNPSTGTKLIPVAYRYAGSAAAAITLLNGSGGGSLWSGNTIIANAEQWGPWWDVSATGANNSIEITVASGVGTGYFELWVIVVPAASSLTQ